MLVKKIIRYFMDKNSSFSTLIENYLVFFDKMKDVANLNFSLNDRELINLINVSRKHEKAFAEFKGCNTGKKVAVIATGPSLNNYKKIDNVINIGVNKSFLKDGLTLDYIFMQDYRAQEYINELDNPKYEKIIKFFGVAPEYLLDRKSVSLKKWVIPESIVIKYKARQYFQHCTYAKSSIKFYKDIETNYIECGGSVALAAMQFALYTNPAVIYLVGCDCSSGHYCSQSGDNEFSHLIVPWLKLKEFAEIYYPETKIVSVNPVGLKSVFEDLYQK